MREVRLILNSQAGSKAELPTNRTSVEDVIQAVQRCSLTDDVHLTDSDQEAVDLTRDVVTAGYDVVAGAGGDGWIGVIAAELLHSHTALGVVPMGSVMNIARMHGVPRKRDDAVDLLCAGSAHPIAVGLANGQVFYEVGSIGMNAAIFEEFQRIDDGDLRALFSGIWVAFRYRSTRMTIRIDSGEFTSRALMVSVANGPYTGIGFTVAPNAALGDGLFDVRVFHRFSRVELILHLGSTAFGRRRFSPRVETFRSRRVTIRAVSQLPVRADAHALGTTPITFECLPAALCVIAPRPASPQPAG